MKNINNLFLSFLVASVVLTSCDKDEPEDPVIPNEEEVITTLILTLNPENGGDPIVFSFRDLDGDGGDSPISTSPTLDSNTVYIGSLELLNEIANPPEDITVEILEEAEEHQFFFQSTVPGVSVEYNDLDANQNPIGVSSIITTGGFGNGTLKVTLRHEPDKSAAGVAEGDIANAGGETDIEVVFDVLVQ